MTKEPHSRPHAERRRDVRREVHLKGTLISGGKTVTLEIGDLSFSGALILVKGSPPAGTCAELWVEDYGPIAVQIVHSGAYFCGVAFKDHAGHRTPLLRWLSEDTAPMQMRRDDVPPVMPSAA
jgi:hypothetical protein